MKVDAFSESVLYYSLGELPN